MNKFLRSTAAISLCAAMALGATMFTPKASHAADPFIGQIQMFGFNFPPRGWAHCNGQLLSIAQNTALFSLLGTTFGGNGETTFGLPDLRGRSAKHVGSGPGLTPVQWGQRGGAENVTLTTSHLPSHSHTLRGQSANGDRNSPSGNAIAPGGSRTRDFKGGAAPNVSMASGSITNTGGGQSFDIRNPFLGIYHSIALTGIFPSQN